MIELSIYGVNPKGELILINWYSGGLIGVHCIYNELHFIAF